MSSLLEDRTMHIDVDGCARCAGDHSQLVFRAFARPAAEWTHWAMCPATEEPILLVIVDGIRQAAQPRRIRGLMTQRLMEELVQRNRALEAALRDCGYVLLGDGGIRAQRQEVVGEIIFGGPDLEPPPGPVEYEIPASTLEELVVVLPQNCNCLAMPDPISENCPVHGIEANPALWGDDPDDVPTSTVEPRIGPPYGDENA